MRKEYRELKKIITSEGGEIINIEKHDRMDKVLITFDGKMVSYNSSTSKHCNFEKVVRYQVRALRKKIA